jgi:two-component system sensor histidine kinase HydH
MSAQTRSIGSIPPAVFNQRLWFAVTGFAVICGLTIAFGLLMTNFMRDRMLQREATVTREFFESIIRAERSGEVVFATAEAGMNPQLTSFVGHILGMTDVLRANVYGTDRRILWSTDAALIGQTFGANPELEEAFGDVLVTEIGLSTDDNKAEHIALNSAAGEAFIEAYMPMHDNGRIIGVVELYKVPKALNAVIRDGRRMIWFAASANGVILFLSLFWIVRRGARLIERQQGELARLETLAATGQMAGAIAHNLRNPLSGIRSTAELLSLEAPEAAAMSKDIIGEVDRLDIYVRELLDYTSRDGPTLADVHPEELVRLTLASTRILCERANVTVAVENRLPPSASVRVDQQMLVHAMVSIVCNAIEAMTSGGRLSVRTQSSGRFFVVQFDDTGHGIPPEILQRVSEPFFTTKTRGLGLGLAQVQRIVEQFKGRLEIASPKGGGAQIRVLLPQV